MIESKQIKYSAGYKYQLREDAWFKTTCRPPEMVETTFLTLRPDGWLHIKTGYAWDGASGAIDTDSIMRGSLFHDAMYQLLRSGLLPAIYKGVADIKFQRCCIEDKMFKVRAHYVYKAVEKLGTRSTLPKNKKKILIAP